MNFDPTVEPDVPRFAEDRVKNGDHADRDRSGRICAKGIVTPDTFEMNFPRPANALRCKKTHGGHMGRIIRALLMVVCVASCGGGSSNAPAPKNLDNACSIAASRPNYMRAFKRVERKWGVPVHVQMATIHQESKFVSNARTPLRFALGVIPIGRQSSAYGYSQALDGTWDEYKVETGKRRAMRDDIQDATDFMGWYMTKTRERNGISLSDTRNQYLAYHEGHTGYARGSYNRKAWLVRVADRVAARGDMYRQQLARCRR